MRVEAPRVAASALPGQFVIVRADEQGERVPLTVADYDRTAGTVTIVTQTIGVSTRKICALEAGDALADFAGPLGHPSEFVTLSPEALRGRRYLFVAGGVGKGMVTGLIRELIDTRGKRYDECVAIGPMVMMKFVALATREYGLKTTVSLNALMVDGTGMCGACRVTVGGKTFFTCVDGPEFDGHAVDFDEAMRRQGMYRTQEERARAIAAEREAGHRCRIGLDK